MRSVGRRYHFDAEHSVQGLGPRWADPHWHRYTVEVVATDELEGRSAVLSTDELDARYEQHLDLDGQNLNAMIGGSTTVEALAAYWLEWFREVSPLVREVTVWEDDARWGRVTRA